MTRDVSQRPSLQEQFSEIAKGRTLVVLDTILATNHFPPTPTANNYHFEIKDDKFYLRMDKNTDKVNNRLAERALSALRSHGIDARQEGLMRPTLIAPLTDILRLERMASIDPAVSEPAWEEFIKRQAEINKANARGK